MSILVIDVGTSGVRAAIVSESGQMTGLAHRPTPPSSPAPGLVEFDGEELFGHVLDVSHRALAASEGAAGDAGSPVRAVGITTQRASSLAWSRSTGAALAPGIGWQDLRTVGDCIGLRASHGLGFAPNQSATKMTWLLAALADHDPDDICLGTVDSWLVWKLTGGRVHSTDSTNAAVTGLTDPTGSRWQESTLSALGIAAHQLPVISPTIGVIGDALALPGAPPLAAVIGDQQGSLIGQGCIVPGATKITFGTGGMLDTFVGTDEPRRAARSENGTFPVVAFSSADEVNFGTEAVMLSAGTNVEWLCSDLGLIDSPGRSHELAASCADSDGVVYVPALLGLGTPHWDYGARGTLLGLTRGTTAAHVVRAVLEGVAHRGVDMLEAARADTGLTIESVGIDGGMSRNPTFVQSLADAAGMPVRVSAVTEATGLGAAFCAGVATGLWADLGLACSTVAPAYVAEPAGPPGIARDRWAEAVERSRGWIPALSGLDF